MWAPGVGRDGPARYAAKWGAAQAAGTPAAGALGPETAGSPPARWGVAELLAQQASAGEEPAEVAMQEAREQSAGARGPEDRETVRWLIPP